MNYPSLEFDRAVAAMCDDALDASEPAGLAELLHRDPAARDAYLFAVELHARLASDNALFLPAPEADNVVPLPPLTPHQSPITRSAWLKAAALLALAALLVGLYFGRPAREPFAHLAKSAGAQFANGVEAQEGRPIRGETLKLTRGSVELATARGVTVVMEAPAEFRFESAQRLRLTQGKAAAEVPPAGKGFTIATPSGEVIDLGTKFGVDVARSGASEVHVFQGEVIAGTGRGAAQKQSLRQDEALALRAGAAERREMRTAAFIHADELQSLAAGLRAGRQARWVESIRALRADPALLAVLDLAEAQSGEFRWAQGRWPGTRAAEFTQPGDFLPVEFSGTTDELTLAAWVRLDRVPRAINSLLHTNGWGQPGQVHWMVAENQRMRFAIYDVRCVDQSENRYPQSRSLVTAATGRWTHLAVVYEAPRRAVRFYIDGRFDNEVLVLDGIPAVLGPARVGNWNRQERILSGRLDELVLLRRALGDAEIRALFDAGNPYQ